MEVLKISCGADLAPIECINPRRDRWAVRWDIHQEQDAGWFASEVVVDHRPTVEEIREIITAHIDATTQNDIVNGFSWKGKPVKLTDTAQRNFLFAVFTVDRTGEIDREQFVGLLDAQTDAEAADELADMVSAIWGHIQQKRADGITAKNAVDFSKYAL